MQDNKGYNRQKKHNINLKGKDICITNLKKYDLTNHIKIGNIKENLQNNKVDKRV